MKQLSLLFFLLFITFPGINAQIIELESESNRDPDVLFQFTRSGSSAGKTILDKKVSSFVNEATLENVASIVDQSKCSKGIYDFNLGTTTESGLLEFTLPENLQLCYESIDVYANQYETSTEKYPASLSVNGSEYFPITHEPIVAGGYKTIQTTNKYGKYRFPLADPDVALTTVKLESTGRIVLKQLNFNLKQNTQAIEELETDTDCTEEYYNLEGRKIEPENLRSGVYVVRKGKSTTKIIIRN